MAFVLASKSSILQPPLSSSFLLQCHWKAPAIQVAMFLLSFLLFSYLVTSTATSSTPSHSSSSAPLHHQPREPTPTSRGGGGPNIKDNEEDKKGWLVWVQVSCLILAALGITAKVYTKCQSCCQCCADWRCMKGREDEDQVGADTVICYLCTKKVSRSEWDKEENGHRSYCAVKSKEHRDVLSEMPRTSLPCDNCGELLRIWPSNMGPTAFKCQEPECWSRGGIISNNGTNRFNCFTCDLDICRDCGNAEMADAKDIKDDPLVLAATIINQHRGSRTSVKQYMEAAAVAAAATNTSSGSTATSRRKPLNKKHRRRSSFNPSSISLSSTPAEASSTPHSLSQNMRGASGLILSPAVSLWMVPPYGRSDARPYALTPAQELGISRLGTSS